MSAATINFGGQVVEITDPRHIQPVSADLGTEAREYNGIVCLSFATLITDGNAEPRAEISARIRMTMAGALDLKNLLDTVLKGSVPNKANAN